MFVVRRSPLRRTLAVVIAAALTSGVLAGCTGGPFGGGCEPQLASGDASSTIESSGSAIDAEFPTPLIAEQTQVSRVSTGDGERVEPGSAVLVSFVYYVGATGETLGDQTALVTASEGKRDLGLALACVPVGSRVAIAGPASDIDSAYDGITETLVAVVDVEAVFLGKANGVNQLPLDGMPTVVTAVDGTPGIALAYTEAPAETRVATIKAGGGAVVEDGDTVVYHLRSWNWPATDGGQPTIGQLDTWAAYSPGQQPLDLASGRDFDDAVVGSTVGSQLLLVIAAPEGGQATIAVIDVLGILEQ